VRVRVARGSIPYSLDTHPLPLLRRKAGTASSTEAVDHPRVADFNQRGAFGGMDEVRENRDRTDLIGGAVVGTKKHLQRL